jgi:hypothetical protein
MRETAFTGEARALEADLVQRGLSLPVVRRGMVHFPALICDFPAVRLLPSLPPFSSEQTKQKG